VSAVFDFSSYLEGILLRQELCHLLSSIYTTTSSLILKRLSHLPEEDPARLMPKTSIVPKMNRFVVIQMAGTGSEHA
jgi:hypothetical protein